MNILRVVNQWERLLLIGKHVKVSGLLFSCFPFHANPVYLVRMDLEIYPQIKPDYPVTNRRIMVYSWNFLTRMVAL